MQCSLTSEQREELCRLYYEGEMRITDIARQYGVGVSTVRYLGDKYTESIGLRRKKKLRKNSPLVGLGQDEVLKIRLQHKNGTSITKLAQLHNVSANSIATMLKRPKLTKEEKAKGLKAPRNKEPADYNKMYEYVKGVIYGGGPIDLTAVCNTRGFGAKKVMSMFEADIHEILKKAMYANKLYMEQRRKHLELLKEFSNTLEALYDNKSNFTKKDLTKAFFNIKW